MCPARPPSAGTETEQCVPVLAASAVLFPSRLAGRRGLLVLAATVTQSRWHCPELFRTHYLLSTSTLPQYHPSLSLSMTILS